MNRLTGRMLLVGAAFALFLIPVAAIAGAGFTDVEDDNIFVEDIQWLSDTGITRGCAPDRFCPRSNVTRQQMAAFLHRMALARVVDAATVEGMTAAELKGAPGPAGPAGAAGADGDKITFYKVEASTVAWNDSTVGSNPACTAGDQAISGSYTTLSPGPSSYIMMTTNSMSADGESWVFQGMGEGLGSYDSLVLCAHVTTP